MSPPLAPRGFALEAQFFSAREEKLLEKMRANKARSAARESLREASSITDDDLLDSLVQLGVTIETMAALAMVPQVMVAWASGGVDSKEEAAIMEAAKSEGMTDACRELLESWLSHQPDDNLLPTWQEYIGSLCEALDQTQRDMLKSQVLGNARKVAEASGGLLGIGSVSKDESAMLDQLESAFE